MKKLILIVILATIGWQVIFKSPAEQHVFADAQEETQVAGLTQATQFPTDTPAIQTPYSPPAATPSSHIYTCDGRTYCSQMHSCEEATFFLRNCQGVKMDGDNDGIPCEQQWC